MGRNNGNSMVINNIISLQGYIYRMRGNKMKIYKWEFEPDFEEFTHAGYRCLIKRIEDYKHLCGYVFVNKEHPLYGKEYSDLWEIYPNISVHGGITYSELDDATGDWQFGFDCCHCNDLRPSELEDWINYKDKNYVHYRSFEYVKQEVMNLAEQFKDIAEGNIVFAEKHVDKLQFGELLDTTFKVLNLKGN